MKSPVNHRVSKADVFFVARKDRDVITVPKDRARPVKDCKVDELVESILAMGQLTNVVAVGGFPEGLKVIAGARRVAAINKIWDEDLDRDNPIKLQVNRIFIAESDEGLVETAGNLHKEVAS
jgi:ParB-like nuclease family protein